MLAGVRCGMGLPQFPYVVEKGSVSVTIYHGVYKGYHNGLGTPFTRSGAAALLGQRGGHGWRGARGWGGRYSM